MPISRQNQQMLLGLALILAVGLVVSRLLENGVDTVGEKGRVLALADLFAQCTTREQYLALLDKHFPPAAPLGQLKSAAADEATTHPAHLERLADGRLKVVVPVQQTQDVLAGSRRLYLPAALVDNNGCGRRLVDIRVNSRQSDLVFEYYFAGAPEDDSRRLREFRFFMGRMLWQILPSAGPTN